MFVTKPYGSTFPGSLRQSSIGSSRVVGTIPLDPFDLISETSQSPAMQPIVQSISRISMSDLGILLIGEYGTGKEWLARKLHQIGPRARNVFMSLDCVTLTPATVDLEIFGQERLQEKRTDIDEGILGEAAGGTIFFDDFISLPEEIQMKVARATAHKKYHRLGGIRELWFDARVVLSIRRRPNAMSPEGIRLQDIFSRVSPVVLELPPLRGRMEDMLSLLNLFLAQMNDRYRARVRGISPEALKLMMSYAWPGNIRELQNTVEYAVMMSGDHLIQPLHLPLQIRTEVGRRQSSPITKRQKSVSAVEKSLLMDALRQSTTTTGAADLLGISLDAFQTKLEYYNLDTALTRRLEETEQSDEL